MRDLGVWIFAFANHSHAHKSITEHVESENPLQNKYTTGHCTFLSERHLGKDSDLQAPTGDSEHRYHLRVYSF